MEVKAGTKEEEEGQNISSLIGACIATVVGMALLSVVRRILGGLETDSTTLAIISPRGKVYFFPHFQAIRIVRKHNWSFGRLNRLSSKDILRAILKRQPVYSISSAWGGL